METIIKRLAALGVRVPEILLPREGTDLTKWAVIACDQFTQDRAYWEEVKTRVGNSPSTLNLIYPEVYLGDADRPERIRRIHQAMESYLEGAFAPPRRCCVYLERRTPWQGRRRGLVLAIDLEAYDWRPGATSLIRATEGTLPERLPSRIAVRRGAPLETSHVLLLIDDQNDTLIPALGEFAKKAPLYDTDLLPNGGHVSGWALEGAAPLEALAAGVEALARKALVRDGSDGNAAPFLFASGDGNHSLACAKAVWEEYKASHAGEAGLEEYPARYALVELVNLYDEGLCFEPIHRVVFNAEPGEILTLLEDLRGFRCREAGDRCIAIEGDSLVTPALDTLLERFCNSRTDGPAKDRVKDRSEDRAGGRTVDYIHGKEELRRVAREPAKKAVGLLLPPFEKKGLFDTVARTGPLPRKSFSLGEAEEKRYYLECRNLFRA